MYKKKMYDALAEYVYVIGYEYLEKVRDTQNNDKIPEESIRIVDHISRAVRALNVLAED